jgi:hypothetical protein
MNGRIRFCLFLTKCYVWLASCDFDFVLLVLTRAGPESSSHIRSLGNREDMYHAS